MPILDDLVAHWKLDESSGVRGDTHGTNNLTDNNTVTSAAGKLSNAAEFVAANSEYLSIADNAALSMGSGQAFTIVAWVYLASKTTFRWILSKGTTVGSDGGYDIAYHVSDNAFEFVCNDGTAVAYAVPSGGAGLNPSINTWYFIVAGYEGGINGRTFIQVNDGTEYFATPGGGFSGAKDDPGQFEIGRYTFNSGYHFDGRIDSVSIFKRDLTAAERTCIYNAGAGRDYPFVGCGDAGGEGRWEVYFKGMGNGADFSAGDYGDPTVFILNEPIANRLYILSQPVADLSGFKAGDFCMVKARRFGGGSDTSIRRETILGIQICGDALEGALLPPSERPDPVPPPFEPSEYADYLFEYDADLELYSESTFTTPITSGAVGGWKDQNANLHPLIQVTAANKPTLATGGPGGHSYVTGDGVNDKLAYAFVSDTWGGDSGANVGGTAYFVLRQETWISSADIMGGNTAQTQGNVIQQSNTSPELDILAGAHDASLENSELPLATWGVLSVIYADTGNSMTRINLSTRHEGSTVAASDNTMQGWCFFNNRNGLFPANVSIARAIGYSSKHSASVQDTIVAALMSEYGIS